VRQNYRRFQELPPDRRQLLRQRWRNATPAQRQEMLQQLRDHRMQRMQEHMQRSPRPPHG
jgi:TRAP-type C4-dicarboxylate transport system substrate-binding protein